MKRIQLKLISYGLLLAFSATQFWAVTSKAEAHGGGATGGGDRCEERFKVIAEDFQKWISEGGAQSLDFSALNFETNAVTYAQKMTEQISKARVTCVGPGDVGYPVLVNGKPKECLNYVDDFGISRIVCDRTKFYSGKNTPDDQDSQYRIVHHEYASLAKLETPDGDNSNYALSRQITLVDQVIRRLAAPVKSSSENSSAHLEFCISLGYGDFYEMIPLLKGFRAFCNDGRQGPGILYRTFHQPMLASFAVEGFKFWTSEEKKSAQTEFKNKALSLGYMNERTVVASNRAIFKIISKQPIAAQQICLVNGGELLACTEGLQLASNALDAGSAAKILRANGFSKIGSLTAVENFDWNQKILEIYVR